MRWIALFFVFFLMIATADGSYRLNWAIASGAWNKLQEGWKGFGKAQEVAAKQLDAETQRRYGFDPLEPRAASCVSTPTGIRLDLQALVKLKSQKPADRVRVIDILGEPYCKISSGQEIWLVGSVQILEIDYNPVTYRLREK